MKIVLPHDFVPREYQARYMRYFDGGGTRAVWCVHRRGGKDLTALHQLAKMAHERVGVYWHCLPTLKQARKVIWGGFRNDGKRFLDNAFPPEIVASRNESEMRLDLKCGSVVQIVGSDNYDSLVGSNPIGVVFSEFALSKPSAWHYIRPILAANGGWASFISTPRGFNEFHSLWKYAQTDPKWFCETQTIHDTQALPATILEEERRAGMPEALIQQEYCCDFNAALVGSVWGDLVDALAKRGGLEAWETDRDEVFTAWDLGMSDSTAIWFFRVGPRGIEFIDYLEGHGQPLSYYCDEIDAKGYQVIKHWLPHDAKQRHLSTGTSVLEQLQMRFGTGRIAIGPRMALLDGIQAGRWLLQQETRFHPDRCSKGLECLRAYHYEYDEDSRSYGDKPAHDWSSHGADAFRYAAVVAKVSGIFKPKPKPKVTLPDATKPVAFTLDQLWAIHESRPRPRRIG